MPLTCSRSKTLRILPLLLSVSSMAVTMRFQIHSDFFFLRILVSHILDFSSVFEFFSTC